MTSANYFLIAAHKGVGDLIKTAIDITEIDLYTENYSREELLGELGYARNEFQNIDLYIMRVKESKNKGMDVKFYDTLFKGSNISLVPLQEHRLNKIKLLHSNLKIDDHPEFKNIVEKLLRAITLNRNEVLSPIIHHNNVLDMYVKDLLKELYYANHQQMFNALFPSFCDKLSSYKKLRGLFMEYSKLLNAKMGIRYPRPCDRWSVHYDSFCFGYNEPFHISVRNALEDEDKTFFLKYQQLISPEYEDALKEKALLEKIRLMPFQNKEMEVLYQTGGVASVMSHMDGNDIYTSCDEDLVKIGVLSIEDYIQKNKDKESDLNRY